MLEGQQINQRGNLEDPKIKEPTIHDYFCDVLFCSLHLCISRICCLEKSCHFVCLLGVNYRLWCCDFLCIPYIGAATWNKEISWAEVMIPLFYLNPLRKGHKEYGRRLVRSLWQLVQQQSYLKIHNIKELL